ncbi:MAG: NAD(P)-dependent oxidoreductase [Candidatus Aenigmatarchaeota archaeon]
MKFLVIGASGCIGNALIEFLLENKLEVKALIHETPISQKNIEFFKGDINEPSTLLPAMKDIDVVYHLAFPMTQLAYSLPYKDLFYLQCKATENIIKSAISSGVKRIVYVSSVSVYGNPKYFPIDENHPTNPKNYYALTKLETEKILKNYSNEIETVILRAAPVYGPKSKIFYKLLEEIEKGKLGIIGDGNKKTHLLGVKNCALALYLSGIKQNINNEIFNIADLEPIKFNELYKLIIDYLNIKEIKKIPYWKAYLFALFSEFYSSISGKSAKFSKAFLETLTRERIYSIEKAKNILGYIPRVSIEEGIKEMIKAYKLEKQIR